MSATAGETDFDPNRLLEEATDLAPKDPEGARDLLNTVVLLAEEMEDLDLASQALAIRAQCHAMMSEKETATRDAREAIAGFEKTGDERRRAGVLNTLAIIKEEEGDYTTAFGLQLDCLEIFKDHGDIEAVATLTTNLGLSCTYVGDWDRALEFYQESLRNWDQMPPSPGRARLLTNLGFAHSSVGDFEEAERLYLEALEIYEKEDHRSRSLVFTNLARCALSRQDIAKAMELAEKALEISGRQKDLSRRAHALESLGSVYIEKGETGKAKQAFRDAGKIYQSLPLPRGQIIILQHLAELEKNDPEKAFEFLSEARSLAQKLDLKPLHIEILESLNKVDQSRGKWKEACGWLESKNRVEKELLQERSILRLKSLELEMKLEQSRKETELERRRVEQLGRTMDELQEEKRRAEEESRQKSEILNFAAHDLRNLIWGVIGPLDLVQEDRDKLSSLPETRELLDAASESAQRLNETLKNVLSAAAIDAGRLELERQSQSPSRLIEESLKQWRPVAARKGQRIVHTGEKKEIVLPFDRLRLTDCLNNLLSNAIKYSPFRSRIEIWLEVREDSVAFAVADHGPGLSEEDFLKFGRPFQKLSAKPTGDELSIGVGLAVVKRLMELHGGRLEVECPDTGGSLFRLVLPK